MGKKHKHRGRRKGRRKHTQPDEMQPMTATELLIPESFRRLEFARTFDEPFDVDGPPDPSRWKFDTMDDALNRSGNSDIDRDGTPKPGSSVNGKRWAAWYDEHHDKTCRIVDGKLEQRGYLEHALDPTRRCYERHGRYQPYGERRLYTSWIHTWAREKTDGEWHDASDSPNILFGPGTYFEARVDFSKMCMPGHRSSAWLMPARENCSKAYNADAADGVEVDWWEYDPRLHLLQCKVIGGHAGNTPGGGWDPREHGVDLTAGPVTMGLLWLTDRIVWLCNGRPFKEDREHVPQVPHYLILSREANSGVRTHADDPHPGDVGMDEPYRPWDVGLYGVSVADSFDKVDEDVVTYDYVRAYNVTGDPALLDAEDEPTDEPDAVSDPKPAAEPDTATAESAAEPEPADITPKVRPPAESGGAAPPPESDDDVLPAEPTPDAPSGEPSEPEPDPAEPMSVAELASGLERAEGWARWLAGLEEGAEPNMSPRAAEAIRVMMIDVREQVEASDGVPVAVTVTIGGAGGGE